MPVGRQKHNDTIKKMSHRADCQGDRKSVPLANIHLMLYAFDISINGQGGHSLIECDEVYAQAKLLFC